MLRERSANEIAMAQKAMDELENLFARKIIEDELLWRELKNRWAEVLRGHGHPSIVAARYQPQRSLIGPEIFPFYWYTIQKTLPWVITIVLLSRVIEGIYGPPQNHIIANALGSLFSVLFYFFSWMTLTFAAIDLGLKFYPKKVTLHADWDPRKLPKVEPGAEARPDEKP